MPQKHIGGSMSVVTYIQQVQGCWQGAQGGEFARLLAVDDASRPKMPAGQQGLQVRGSMRFSHHPLRNPTTRQRPKHVRRSVTSHCWRVWFDITSPRRHGPEKGGILRHTSIRSSAKGQCAGGFWQWTELLIARLSITANSRSCFRAQPRMVVGWYRFCTR